MATITEAECERFRQNWADVVGHDECLVGCKKMAKILNRHQEVSVTQLCDWLGANSVEPSVSFTDYVNIVLGEGWSICDTTTDPLTPQSRRVHSRERVIAIANNKATQSKAKLNRHVQNVSAALAFQKCLEDKSREAQIELKDRAASSVAQCIEEELSKHEEPFEAGSLVEGRSRARSRTASYTSCHVPIAMVLESIHSNRQIYSDTPHPSTEVGIDKQVYDNEKREVFDIADLECWTRTGRVIDCDMCRDLYVPCNNCIDHLVSQHKHLF